MAGVIRLYKVYLGRENMNKLLLLIVVGMLFGCSLLSEDKEYAPSIGLDELYGCWYRDDVEDPANLYAGFECNKVCFYSNGFVYFLNVNSKFESSFYNELMYMIQEWYGPIQQIKHEYHNYKYNFAEVFVQYDNGIISADEIDYTNEVNLNYSLYNDYFFHNSYDAYKEVQSDSSLLHSTRIQKLIFVREEKAMKKITFCDEEFQYLNRDSVEVYFK